MPEYRLYTYDLWGNEEEGFQVNDVYRQADIFSISAEMSDSDIIKELDFITPDNVEIDSNSDTEMVIYFQTKDTAKPLCELRNIDN